MGTELTGREREVLPLLAAGFDDAMIANQLGVTLSTAKKAVHGAYAKLGATNRASAVALAYQHGFLTQEGMGVAARLRELRDAVIEHGPTCYACSQEAGAPVPFPCPHLRDLTQGPTP